LISSSTAISQALPIIDPIIGKTILFKNKDKKKYLFNKAYLISIGDYIRVVSKVDLPHILFNYSD
jgi:hypothetical protein